MSFFRLAVSARILRWVALSYALKALLVALVWLFAPQLFARGLEQARAALAPVAAALGWSP